MKKLIIFLLLIVAGTPSVIAQSILKVSMADRSVINVSVDGRYFNRSGSSVTVGDLPPGKHLLQIYAITQDRRGRAKEDVIYEGKVRTSNGAVTLFVFDANTGQTDVQDQDMSSYTANAPQGNQGSDPNMNNNNYPYNNQNGQNGNYSNNNNAPVASPITQGTLTDGKISKLKDKTAAIASDTKKFDALKEGLKSETFTTDQVSAIMGWLIFEETKVSFAEWAYNNTVDKNNFRNLENQFSYKNSQDELDKFLQGQK